MGWPAGSSYLRDRRVERRADRRTWAWRRGRRRRRACRPWHRPWGRRRRRAWCRRTAACRSCRWRTRRRPGARPGTWPAGCSSPPRTAPPHGAPRAPAGPGAAAAAAAAWPPSSSPWTHDRHDPNLALLVRSRRTADPMIGSSCQEVGGRRWDGFWEPSEGQAGTLSVRLGWLQDKKRRGEAFAGGRARAQAQQGTCAPCPEGLVLTGPAARRGAARLGRPRAGRWRRWRWPLASGERGGGRSRARYGAPALRGVSFRGPGHLYVRSAAAAAAWRKENGGSLQVDSSTSTTVSIDPFVCSCYSFGPFIYHFHSIKKRRWNFCQPRRGGGFTF